jgi:hypothetical protein
MGDEVSLRPTPRKSRRPGACKDAWWRQLQTCYRKGYEAGQGGQPESSCPYGNHGNVDMQRRQMWLRGRDRAKKGLPFNDWNG